MAQFISLEQAARLLGMSPEVLKGKAQGREIRAFQDGGTWQFRESDVLEYQRKLGLGSDPDLTLSDFDLDSADSDSDLDLSDFQLDIAGSSEKDILLDDQTSAPAITGSSSTIIGVKPTGKQPSDSDVKLLPTQPIRTSSDSDVRLAPGQPRQAVSPNSGYAKSPAAGGQQSGETSLGSSPVLGAGSKEISPGSHDDSDSDFDLSPSGMLEALQPDAGSDFEMTSLDGSDEFVARPPSPKRPADSDVTGASASNSGINLGRPADSGISLHKDSFDFSSADLIELAPLDDEKPSPAAKQPAAQAKVAPKVDPGATALPVRAKVADPGATALPVRGKAGDPGATALPVRGKAGDPGATALPIKAKAAEKDIFEDTDFEVDAIDASRGDRTMQLEATSDFDIDEGDSASEVFALDEDDADKNAATAMTAAPEFEDMDAEAASSEQEIVRAGSRGGAKDDSADSWGAMGSDESAPAVAAGARSASPMLGGGAGPEWGTPWVVLLGIGTLLSLIGGFVAMDLVHNFNEFRADGPASGLVKAIAGLFGS